MRDSDASFVSVLAALALAGLMCAVPVCGGCDANDEVREVLEPQGFTDINPTGYEFFACGKDDSFNSGFTATSVTGERVSGVVCCGLLKSCTVRW